MVGFWVRAVDHFSIFGVHVRYIDKKLTFLPKAILPENIASFPAGSVAFENPRIAAINHAGAVVLLTDRNGSAATITAVMFPGLLNCHTKLRCHIMSLSSGGFFVLLGGWQIARPLAVFVIFHFARAGFYNNYPHAFAAKLASTCFLNPFSHNSSLSWLCFERAQDADFIVRLRRCLGYFF